MAFGLAVAAFVFDLDDVFEGRKINFLVVRCPKAYLSQGKMLKTERCTDLPKPQVHSTVLCLQVGDWGRNGLYNQSLVAAAMAQQAKKSKPIFIISTGDNFYESQFSCQLWSWCRDLLANSATSIALVLVSKSADKIPDSCFFLCKLDEFASHMIAIGSRTANGSLNNVYAHRVQLLLTSQPSCCDQVE